MPGGRRGPAPQTTKREQFAGLIAEGGEQLRGVPDRGGEPEDRDTLAVRADNPGRPVTRMGANPNGRAGCLPHGQSKPQVGPVSRCSGRTASSPLHTRSAGRGWHDSSRAAWSAPWSEGSPVRTCYQEPWHRRAADQHERATQQTWRGGPRVRPPHTRIPPAGSVTMRCFRPSAATTRRWPRTGSACRPATRCRNDGSPRCSDAHPAAGHEPESPRHDRHRRSRTRRAPRSPLNDTPRRHLGERTWRKNPPSAQVTARQRDQRRVCARSRRGAEDGGQLRLGWTPARRDSGQLAPFVAVGFPVPRQVQGPGRPGPAPTCSRR